MLIQVKWPKYRTPLPGHVRHLASVDERINKIVVDGLKNKDTTLDILDDVIGLLNQQRFALHNKLKEIQK